MCRFTDIDSWKGENEGETTRFPCLRRGSYVGYQGVLLMLWVISDFMLRCQGFP